MIWTSGSCGAPPSGGTVCCGVAGCTVVADGVAGAVVAAGAVGCTAGAGGLAGVAAGGVTGAGTAGVAAGGVSVCWAKAAEATVIAASEIPAMHRFAFPLIMD